MVSPTQDLLQALLRGQTGAIPGVIPSTTPRNPVTAPSQAAFDPSPVETTVSQQLGINPFAQNFAFGARQRQEGNTDRFLGALLQSNQQAADLSSTQAQGEAQTRLGEALIGQVDQPGVLSLLLQQGVLGGRLPPEFVSELDVSRRGAIQAGAAADVGAGIQAGAAGGQRVEPTTGLQQDIGVTTREVTPTSVQAAETRGRTRGQLFVNGVQVDVPLSPEQAAAVQGRINTALDLPGGTVGSDVPAAGTLTAEQARTRRGEEARLHELGAQFSTTQSPGGNLVLHITHNDDTLETRFIRPDGRVEVVRGRRVEATMFD